MAVRCRGPLGFGIRIGVRQCFSPTGARRPSLAGSLCPISRRVCSPDHDLCAAMFRYKGVIWAQRFNPVFPSVRSLWLTLCADLQVDQIRSENVRLTSSGAAPVAAASCEGSVTPGEQL